MNDNNDNNGGEFEYVVLFEGDEYDVFLSEEEAEDVAEDLRYDYPFVDITVEPQELGESGYYEADAEDINDVTDEVEESFVYPFLERATTVDEFTAGFQSTHWSLGDHTMRNDLDFGDAITEAEDVNPELASILQQAQGMVKSASVSGFECPVCGLNHSHSDQKHDIRTAFSVTSRFADSMEFCPYCHCGVNELAMLMDFFGHINTPIFTDEADFGPVNDLSNEDIRGVVIEIRDAPKGTTVRSAIRDAFGSRDISEEMYDGFEAYYRRLKAVKDAAGHAPISSETRQEIEDLRDAAEEAING
ncbi:hypothetical protein HRTV-2_gp91 [Halorubrum virus HRTV-2]|nr:hypothetical protein HRTV-2_gp91 [Halorubrum virus HRTV-2]